MRAQMKDDFHDRLLPLHFRRPNRQFAGIGGDHLQRFTALRLTCGRYAFSVAIGCKAIIFKGMSVASRTALALVLTWFFALAAWSADGSATEENTLIRSAGDTDLSEFIWEKRPVIVFADSENDPAFIEQLELISRREEELRVRDVVVLTDTDASRLSPVRQKLRPRGFMLVIISKDGRVQARKPFPWDVREITRTIDKLPIRQQEIRDRKNSQ